MIEPIFKTTVKNNVFKYTKFNINLSISLEIDISIAIDALHSSNHWQM